MSEMNVMFKAAGIRQKERGGWQSTQESSQQISWMLRVTTTSETELFDVYSALQQSLLFSSSTTEITAMGEREQHAKYDRAVNY